MTEPNSQAVLAAHIGEVHGVARTPITFHADGSSRSLTIGDVADIKVTALAGQGGNQITIDNHPLCVAPGHAAVAGRSDHLRYTDHGYEWSLSDKNGFFSSFGQRPADHGTNRLHLNHTANDVVNSCHAKARAKVPGQRRPRRLILVGLRGSPCSQIRT